MIDPTTKAGARALERLERELVLWLTTVTPAGQPQTSPVWFLWIDGDVLLFSRADTPRLANVRANPRVAANLDGDGAGGDVVSIEGEARVAHERATPADVPPAYVEKYAAKLAASGWTMESMLVDYPIEIRIRPTRVRAWYALGGDSSGPPGVRWLSTTTPRRSASSTGDRTRSAPRGASRSTWTRLRTATSRFATATR